VILCGFLANVLSSSNGECFLGGSATVARADVTRTHCNTKAAVHLWTAIAAVRVDNAGVCARIEAGTPVALAAADVRYRNLRVPAGAVAAGTHRDVGGRILPLKGF